jgi:hypothetical protein
MGQVLIQGHRKAFRLGRWFNEEGLAWMPQNASIYGTTPESLPNFPEPAAQPAGTCAQLQAGAG